MTVKELIAMLEKLPQNKQVILSKDGEGNSYSPISPDYSKGEYTPNNTWSGEFCTQDEDEDGNEVDLPKKRINAICLWPIN